jgi:23S rRNA (uracil-5-)-methyltransferase RumA
MELIVAIQISENIERTATPECEHYGECGGCSLQDVEYEKQVEEKSRVLSEMLGREVPVIPSPDQYHYRHRMDYITAFGKVGLRKRGDGKTVVNLTKCKIVQPRISELIPKIQGWIEEMNIRGFNIVTNRGDLRFIIFRHAFSSDQLLINVVTYNVQTAANPLIEKLKDYADSVCWSVQSRKGDDSKGTVKEVHGLQTLQQSVGDYTFEISPGCFFQNNLLLVDSMFDEIAKHVSGYTLDLFCGTGTLGIYSSKNASKVVGVEIMEENIRLANINATQNNVDNIEFITDNANHFLAHYDGETPDTVIIDPPRSGLAPKFIRKLNRLGAPKIIYVSCNPKTYLTDLEQFEGYRLESAVGFDMFPQTPHVEMVTTLVRD